MLFIVLDFKDTHGRKGSKMCTSTLLSFLTLFSASCSWQQISCELALQGVFLFIRLCGVLTSLANPVLLSCAGSRAMLGAVLGVCRPCLSTDPASPQTLPYRLSGAARATLSVRDTSSH